MSAEEDQLKREIAFAERGSQVINNEAYKQAIAIRKAQIFEVFCGTNKDQSDVREEAWRTMVNMKALEQYFETLLTTGKMAESTLELNESNK